MSLEITADLYGEILKETEDGFSERIHDSLKFITWLFSHIGIGKGKKKINLFVAGGTGRHAIAASLLGVGNITYLDLSIDNIDRVKKVCRENSLNNIKIIQSNIMDIQMIKKFDVCISEGVVQHLPDCTEGLRILLKTVKEKGFLFFTLYRYGTLVYLIFERLRRLYDPKDYHEMALTLNKLALYDSSLSFSSGSLGRYLLDDLFVPYFGTFPEDAVVKNLEGAGLEVLYHDNLPKYQFSLPVHKALYFITRIPENFKQSKLDTVKLTKLELSRSNEFADYVNETIDVLDKCIEKYSNTGMLEKNVFSIGLTLFFNKCWKEKLFEKNVCQNIIKYINQYWL